MSAWSWLSRATLSLWEQAKREHSSPREIGCSVGLGVFSGCTPAFGFHMWVAIALASLLRLNRLWAFVGSRISFTPVYAWIVFCEIEGAHRLRTGSWMALSPSEAAAHAWDVLTDWLLGTVLVGGVLGAALGTLAYVLALRSRPRSGEAGDVPSRSRPRSGEAGDATPYTPGEPPLATSESPPSAPPAPAP